MDSEAAYNRYSLPNDKQSNELTDLSETRLNVVSFRRSHTRIVPSEDDVAKIWGNSLESDIPVMESEWTKIFKDYKPFFFEWMIDFEASIIFLVYKKLLSKTKWEDSYLI